MSVLKQRWVADVTRTWPVSGSPTQRDIYNVVLAAHDAVLVKIRPGVEYRDIHLLAATIIAEGLVDLEFYRETLKTWEMDAHALFFSLTASASAGIGCPRYGRFGRFGWV